MLVISSFVFVICDMTLSIRYAGSQDAMLIADISHQTFYETFAVHNRKEDMDKFLNEQFTRGKLMMEVGAPENIFLLAQFNEEVAGYVKLREGKRKRCIVAWCVGKKSTSDRLLYKMGF